MNWLIMVVSFISVAFVAVPELLAESQTDKSNDTHIRATTLTNPTQQQVTESKLLARLQHEAEAAKKQQAQLKASKSAKKPIAGQNELVFSDQVFLLLGIFNQADQVFVLVKNSQQQLVKARIGDTLGGDVKLTAVTSNTITLANTEQSKEFKLFQRQSNDKTSS
ncbi:hypothetical protein NQT69_15775 [Pseudoalteromonas shioyasakiensis]|uniref:hypothetical protein n=1 Tax=Pseudoalteromonas shioyasakiensis TaxID=1190813 RepID=UPI002118DAFB|nr:hypothetical protein [Pseudoalteromonas shioyasakiensis]MCQ8879460.1 hypothetical protein [Pseudoalteromonas shioyasakiensis]